MFSAKRVRSTPPGHRRSQGQSQQHATSGTGQASGRSLKHSMSDGRSPYSYSSDMTMGASPLAGGFAGRCVFACGVCGGGDGGEGSHGQDQGAQVLPSRCSLQAALQHPGPPSRARQPRLPGGCVLLSSLPLQRHTHTSYSNLPEAGHTGTFSSPPRPFRLHLPTPLFPLFPACWRGPPLHGMPVLLCVWTNRRSDDSQHLGGFISMNMDSQVQVGGPQAASLHT